MPVYRIPQWTFGEACEVVTAAQDEHRVVQSGQGAVKKNEPTLGASGMTAPAPRGTSGTPQPEPESLAEWALAAEDLRALQDCGIKVASCGHVMTAKSTSSSSMETARPAYPKNGAQQSEPQKCEDKVFVKRHPQGLSLGGTASATAGGTSSIPQIGPEPPAEWALAIADLRALQECGLQVVWPHSPR